MKIKVELDVFSGRPNPSWIIENDEAKALNDMLQNLPSYKPPASASGGLGYKGFTISIQQQGKEQVLQVYDHMIITGTDSVKILEDKNQVEQKLLQMARTKGYGEILQMLGLE